MFLYLVLNDCPKPLKRTCRKLVLTAAEFFSRCWTQCKSLCFKSKRLQAFVLVVLLVDNCEVDILTNRNFIFSSKYELKFSISNTTFICCLKLIFVKLEEKTQCKSMGCIKGLVKHLVCLLGFLTWVSKLIYYLINNFFYFNK